VQSHILPSFARVTSVAFRTTAEESRALWDQTK
jgi:hypothetical protein